MVPIATTVVAVIAAAAVTTVFDMQCVAAAVEPLAAGDTGEGFSGATSCLEKGPRRGAADVNSETGSTPC